MYTDKVMAHFHNPRNVGEIDNPDGVGTVNNSICGDMIKIFIKVEGHKIIDIKYKTFGCAAAIATSSKLTEMVKDKSLREAKKITDNDVVEALDGLPEEKVHCSNLAAEALHKAIASFLLKDIS